MLSKLVCQKCPERKKLEKILRNDGLDANDNRCPRFNASWEKNFVICPAGLDINSSQDCSLFLILEWEIYKRNIGYHSPSECPYEMEHLLDGTPEEKTYAALMKKNK